MNNTPSPTEKQKDDNSDNVPTMTEDEMKNFFSVISNTEHLQGDYVFNGFLFFFHSVYEAIKKSPVEAQNLMFHLQQHVFNNLMWESFYAFDAHRKKAHLIFADAEPYPKFAEVEAVESLPESSAENLALALSGILRNPHLPEKIHNALAEVLDVPESDAHTPEIILWNFVKANEAEVKR